MSSEHTIRARRANTNILVGGPKTPTLTGVNDQLVRMIKKSLRHGQKLAVGKPEYKTIIEAKLG